MSWARLDDAILDNPKILAAGPLGFMLHVAAITWCARNLTDGRIPKQKVRTLLDCSDLCDLDWVIAQLEQAALWHDRGDAWELHDFLDYNFSRKQVLQRRETTRKRVQKHRQTGQVRRNAVTNAHVTDLPGPGPVPQKKISEKRRARSRFLPPDEILTPERLQFAVDAGLTRAGAVQAWAMMMDHEFSTPRTDTTRTWHNWVRRECRTQRVTPRPEMLKKPPPDAVGEILTEMGFAPGSLLRPMPDVSETEKGH